jgi:5'-deoxynucleotidase YfbR-like HD superfamily hydrolase
MTNFAEVTVRQWRGDVNRWHAHPNPKLRDAGDTIHKHSLRCCLLLMRLNPDFTRDMLAACIMHDAAETFTGDVPWGAKQGFDFAAALESEEDDANEVLEAHIAEPHEHDWIKFVDRLDAYLFVLQNAPKELKRAEWPYALDNILNAASRLRVLDEARDIIAEATEQMT